jgi:benzoate-CoA ligase
VRQRKTLIFHTSSSKVSAKAILNLVEYVFRAARELDRWSEPAILCGDESISYDQLFNRVKEFAVALRRLGVERGERVAIVAFDSPEFVVSFLGTLYAGAVAVPASTMMTASELEYVLDHSGAKLAVISSDQLEKLGKVRPGLSQLREVLLVDGADLDCLSFEESIRSAGQAEVESVGDDELALILYTSGSTGRPKGAMHVHGSLPYTVEKCCKHVIRCGPGDRLFSSSRLFFAYGLGNSLSFPLSTGATSVLCKERPTPEVIARIFERDRPTIFFGVPAVFRALIEFCARGGALDTESLKFCVSAGEKLPESVYRDWKELTGLETLDGIGSTEMLQMFISNRLGEVRPGSSGRVIPGYEAKLLDHDGAEIEGEGEGSLFIKGHSASPGYWKDPVKTAETMRGEWMSTGDIYRRDEEGFYWFEGRSDDLFKVKGLWVSPIEVEDALLSCADVLEAAVVPAITKDGLSGVSAYVVIKSGRGAVDAEELKLFVRSLLPAYKCPTEIHFVDSLPRTATGKLQRFKLR